ncbi:MAG: hypothetical protein JWM10_675 [Myxococcaceae bacterium]|nr:hypothetical protein [Myxococcaceae bacterium]
MSELSVTERAARHVALIAFGAVVVVAVPIGLIKGAPAVALWLAFALLSTAVLFFWETLRLVLDPTQPGDDDEGDDDGAALAALDARKRAALQALRDLEFERSIGRIGEDDHRALEAQYREEARAAMQAIDEGVGPWRARAEAMLAAAAEPSPPNPLSPTGLRGGGEEPEPEAVGPTPTSEAPLAPTLPVGERGQGGEGPATLDCPKCATPNDDDAVFCKRCGQRMKPEVADATH